MIKIAVTCTDPKIPDEYLDQIKKNGTVSTFEVKKLKEKELIELIPETEILICDDASIEYIGMETMTNISGLKLIVVYGVGVNWIDMECAKQKRITICNLKGCNAQSTAEHIWGMILNLSKRISELERATRILGRIDVGNYTGVEIKDKTLGVIGLGNIGRRVAHIGNVMCKNVIGINASQINVDGIKLVNMNTLLKVSDIIVLCVPLYNNTNKMIGEKEIKLMKKGVILVNCAREELVDKGFILNAISKGKIFGYGLETSIFKALSTKDSYFDFPNVLLTPHNAWNTIESNEKSFEMITRIVESYSNGTVINKVN